MVQIIPAIDLMGGRVVRLRQGLRTEQTAYFEDPSEPARAFLEAGARLIHVVDLDGAFGGHPANLELVRWIVRALEGTGCQIELGGGVRNLEAARQVLELGVSRVILGTAMFADPELLPRALAEFGPERVVAGLDARDGKLAVRGWEEVTSLDTLELARRVAAQGARRVIYTDIATDGMLIGPNLPALERICASGLKVIASGGISSLEDVRTVARLEPLGVEGIIIGKALYEGRLTVAEAIAAAGEI